MSLWKTGQALCGLWVDMVDRERSQGFLQKKCVSQVRSHQSIHVFDLIILFWGSYGKKTTFKKVSKDILLTVQLVL